LSCFGSKVGILFIHVEKFYVQVLDGKPYNRKCDVYSFGICLWEIYCCEMPYPDLSFADVSSAVVHQVCPVFHTHSCCRHFFVLSHIVPPH
jgi:serine/threonine protein kinase